jgi:hypothetical protein
MIRMARHWLLAAAIFAAPLACAAAVIEGSGRAATADRPAIGFHALSVSVPSRVDLAQGDAEGLTIEADDNVLARIESRVEDGVLRIRFPEGLAVRPRTPIRIAVRLRSIDVVTLAGAVRLEAAALEVDRLRMGLSGASSARLANVAAHGIRLDASGHCHAMAAGTTQDFELRLSGAGEINAARLEARHARVRIAGSAQVAVWARETLEARITGSGAVRYFGDPVVEKRVVGAGAIERLGAAPP